MNNTFDREGNPISVEECEKKLRDENYKIIKQTYEKDDVLISTVWLGLDHSYIINNSNKKIDPVIFETMVFMDSHNSYIDSYMDRYSTEEEALAGHERICGMVRNGEIQRDS